MKKIIPILIVLLLLLPSLALAHGDADEIVVLATDNFADSSSAKIFTQKLNAEFVSTEWGAFTDAALAAIEGHKPARVIIVGGIVAIPEDTEARLKALGFEVERLAGSDRYETSALMAHRGWGTANDVIVADGEDSLGVIDAEAEATTDIRPILYTKRDRVPDVVKERLKVLSARRIKHIRAPDTDDAVETDLEEEGRAVERVEKDHAERAENAITKAEVTLVRAQQFIGEAVDDKSTAAHRLLALAEEEIILAKAALTEENYGRAFGQAKASYQHSLNAVHVKKGRGRGHLADKVREAKTDIDTDGQDTVRKKLDTDKADRVSRRARVAKATRVEKVEVELPEDDDADQSDVKDLEDVNDTEEEIDTEENESESESKETVNDTSTTVDIKRRTGYN